MSYQLPSTAATSRTVRKALRQAGVTDAKVTSRLASYTGGGRLDGTVRADVLFRTEPDVDAVARALSGLPGCVDSSVSRNGMIMTASVYLRP